MSSLIGLDIGSSHIKAVELEKREKDFLLKRYAAIPTNKIIGEEDFWDIGDLHNSANSLKDFLAEYKFEAEDVVVVIPQTLTFSKAVKMPILKDIDMQEAITLSANQHIPYPISDVYLKSGIIREFKDDKDSGFADILLVAIKKSYVDRYLRIIGLMGKNPYGIEPSSVSVVRSLVNSDAFDQPTLIVNFGHKSIEFYYVVDRQFVYARSVNFGVSSIIRAISTEFNISLIQGTHYLYSYGISKEALEGRLYEVLSPAMDVIATEIERSEMYIKTRDIFKSKNGINQVKRMVFTGGGALIPDLLAKIPEFTEAEVQLSDSWISVDISQVTDFSSLDRASPLFSAAVGAAMKKT